MKMSRPAGAPCSSRETSINDWQILDVGSIWMKEFASAFVGLAPATAWQPLITNFGAFQRWTRSEKIEDPPLTVKRFPLQRGYARNPISWLLPYEERLLALLPGHNSESADSALICTTPYYAPLADKWRGPVIYYSTDLTVAYHGLDPRQVKNLDRRLCKVASAVCPNSKRIAQYFVDDAGCDPAKITVVPNATRSINVASEPILLPQAVPLDAQHLPRPIAGVIGNLAANMDWVFIAEAIRLTPGINWLFVGPINMPILDEKQSAARDWTRQNALFVGGKPYAELQAYARSFDVAVLPYIKKEPTYSGSSTRFYEHLAACRPMVATRGFAELLEKLPLLTLVDTPVELKDAFDTLSAKNFTDGLESARWVASQSGTWEERARTILATLQKH